jgi:NAD(P)-dependent dehydrogenase (short-subunit alcohol dehydrogenase family)
MGARILVGCRNEERAQAAVKAIQKASGNNDVVFTSPLDLGSFSSIRNFVADLKEKGENIHTLINNAGIMACPHGVHKFIHLFTLIGNRRWIRGANRNQSLWSLFTHQITPRRYPQEQRSCC